MGIIDQMNTEVLKLPLGFIKIVELIFALIAWSAKNGYECDIKILCPDKTNVSTIITGFSLKNILINGCNKTDYIFEQSFSGSSGFFGFVAIVSIFFVLAMLFIYLFSWGLYSSDDRIPQLDLALTSLIAIFWFLATLIWWIGANGLESALEPTNVSKLIKDKHLCEDKGDNKCVIGSYDMYAPLTVSIIAGFGCLILFASNMWFTYKETTWFRQRQMSQQPHTLT